MNRIAILMSTYNGEKYLREQLDSLYNQTITDFDLFIRDDGSVDDTIQIIKSYQERKKNITLIIGDVNLKPAKSFLTLLNQIKGYQYYAFCDQDDVWHSNKLEKAICSIEKIKKPALYCSNYQLVDCNLNKLKDNGHFSSTDFYSSIVFSNATGCTMIFNNILKEKLSLYFPNFIVMHDDWCHKVCLAIGGIVIYDNEKTIDYRQHDNNVDGGIHSFWHKIKFLYKRITNKDNLRSRQLHEIVLGYSNIMSKDKINFIETIYFSQTDKKNIKYRKYILKNNNLKKIDKSKLKKFKLAIKFGYY